MNDFNGNSSSDNDWEERGEMTWNEFDWERYLREQDDTIRRYLTHYESLRGHPDRIDETAHLMGWDDEADGDGDEAVADDVMVNYDDLEPYTLHKNPVFIATKAIYLGIKLAWERLSIDAEKVPQPLALAFQTSLYRGEEQAGLAIQALDLGDYAMAVSLFKRALRELNISLAFTDEAAFTRQSSLVAYRGDARQRLFDLREIWLRMINECRDELTRPIDEEN